MSDRVNVVNMSNGIKRLEVTTNYCELICALIDNKLRSVCIKYEGYEVLIVDEYKHNLMVLCNCVTKDTFNVKRTDCLNKTIGNCIKGTPNAIYYKVSIDSIQLVQLELPDKYICVENDGVKIIWSTGPSKQKLKYKIQIDIYDKIKHKMYEFIESEAGPGVIGVFLAMMLICAIAYYVFEYKS